PIRYAEVEVHRVSDDALLAPTDGSEVLTDQNGQYDIRFQNTGTPGYYVLLKAKGNGTRVKQQVVNQAGNVYTVKSGSVDETISPDATDVNIEVSQDQGAQAFNIFDQGVAGATFIRKNLGVTPPFLTWFWQNGLQWNPCLQTSCYQSANERIL